MSTAITGALSLIALYVGWIQWGWKGLVVAVTIIAFVLILQFNRALRVLRTASGAPVGHIANAVMLNARMREGISLADVIGRTRSLGLKTADEPETYQWQDNGGDVVEVVLKKGRVASWSLRRKDG